MSIWDISELGSDMKELYAIGRLKGALKYYEGRRKT